MARTDIAGEEDWKNDDKPEGEDEEQTGCILTVRLPKSRRIGKGMQNGECQGSVDQIKRQPSLVLVVMAAGCLDC